jgi:hypothetical protein
MTRGGLLDASPQRRGGAEFFRVAWRPEETIVAAGRLDHAPCLSHDCIDVTRPPIASSGRQADQGNSPCLCDSVVERQTATAFSPDPQVPRRLGALPVWRTDEHGGVEWATDGAGVWVWGER